jgi:Domain of unknown function (DUF6321)
MRINEFITESSKICPQCGMKGCTCEPGKCKCKPKPGYPKKVNEAANPKQQAAIAIAMKEKGQKPKNEGYTMEDEQIDGMAQGEIREIIKNAVHIKNQLDNGVSLDGWMYSFVTVSNDKLNSVAEQIGNPNISDEEDSLNEFAPYDHNDNDDGDEEEDDELRSLYDTKAELEAELDYADEEDREYLESELENVHARILELNPDAILEGENWSKYNHKRVGGMSKKSVSSYRRSHPGSKIQTAVTTKPSKLKKGSKAAKRRASFCARMRGMKKHRTSAKTAHDPNSNINKSLRRWHCESVEELHELVMLAEQFIRNHKK